jgi:hypothetical protein
MVVYGQSQERGIILRRIAILTLNGYKNYGNRLQNYALQQVIKKYGFEVETLIVGKSENNLSKKTLNHKGLSLLMIKKIIKNQMKKMNKKSEEIREQKFREFTLQYIKETGINISKNNLINSIDEHYDYFVVGSDQVWNPIFPEMSEVYFLTFASSHKRIAYAPSFGISKLPNEHKEDFSKWLSGMTHISVREDAGAEIVKDLIGIEVPVLVDPTLLLTKNEWLSISKEPKDKSRKRYLLTYFLGGIPKEFGEQINDIANKNKLEIINLGDIREKDTYETGPSEFIDYINECSLLCTDSFHGAVFSIILEKPFIVYEREGSVQMYSRIDTLLNKFELSDRKSDNIDINQNVLAMDYSHVTSILEKERKLSSNYLKNALNIEDVD